MIPTSLMHVTEHDGNDQVTILDEEQTEGIPGNERGVNEGIRRSSSNFKHQRTLDAED